MKGIEIEVLVYSEEELALVELNLEIKVKEELVEKRYFWRIDYAVVNRYNKSQTSFFVADDSFITPMKYEDFIDLINNKL